MFYVELLYFDGCPSWRKGLENLKKALEAEGMNAQNIRLVQILDDEQAQRERFLGSPSFRVNGRDLWEEERQQYRLSCRVYPTPQGLKGAPDVEMLREKIRSVSAAS